jgi:3D (Asp-Asp-Asp) domain-containing protein
MINKYLEERDKSTKLVPFEATFYSKEEVKGHIPSSGIRGSTLSQALKGNGLLQVAVDPKVIPMFTQFNVILEWDGGQSVKAIALDVGGSVKNYLIDIFVDKTSEAILLGRKKVMVQYLN